MLQARQAPEPDNPLNPRGTPDYWAAESGGGGDGWLLELDFENGVYQSSADGVQDVSFWFTGTPVISGGRLTGSAPSVAAPLIAIVSQPHTLVIDYDNTTTGGSNELVRWDGDAGAHSIYQDSGKGEIYTEDGVDFYSGNVVSGRNRIAATLNQPAVASSTNGNPAVGGGVDTIVLVAAFLISVPVGWGVRSLRVKGVVPDADLPALSAP